MNIKTPWAELTTEVIDGEFIICIEQESELSLDGGYTFEDTTNSIELTKDQCRELITELMEFTLEANDG